MRLTETEIPGAYLIKADVHLDERGSFMRTFCAQAFRAHGLNPGVAQSAVSFNPTAATLRGLHFQEPPHAETKLIRCSRGAIHDVLVDLRPDSPAYLRWIAVELRDGDGRLLYAPEGVAHGFQTLEDDTEVAYQLSAPYMPSHARGVRWDDPALGIAWPPAEARIISERDRGFDDFTP